ncbi:MAG: pyridoxal phosphate-dependent aminotransferase [Clostridia bacterium]|nr:pyridoxal phosphate-dependent aminotransferase [Clostridia bacterium]
MISKKMAELVKRSSLIRAMFEEGNRLAAIYGRNNVFDFSLGNPNVPAPCEINAAIHSIVEEEISTILHGYMENSGYLDVRETIANNLNKRFDTCFSRKNIIMTVGAAGGLNVILKSLFDEGEELLVIAPYFGEYGNYASNFNAKLVIVPANPPTFQPDIEEIKARISPLTKAIIVNSPNNPTGVIYSEATITALARALDEKQREYGKSIYIISDEPYRELIYDGAKVPFITKYYKNTIIGYSFSKSLSLPGERIGYLAIPDEADCSAEIIDAANVANRILGFVNAPSLQQKVVARCIDAAVNVDAYNRNRELLYNSLVSFGFECAKPQGAFYLFLKSPIEDDKAFVTAAKKYNLLIVPGSAFAGAGYARIAYCVSENTITNSLPAFKKLAEEFGLIGK